METLRPVTTYLVGDLNIHFSHLVAYPSDCGCVHCKQSSYDRDVTSMLCRAGFTCANPVVVPTHVSGTIIDSVLPRGGTVLPDVTVEQVGMIRDSDLAMVRFDVTCDIRLRYAAGFGRVWWATSAEWNDVLQSIDHALSCLADVLELVISDPIIVSACLSGKQVKRRRRILDAASWLRDAWYCIAGHLAGLVSGTLPTASSTSSMRRAQLAALTPAADAGWCNLADHYDVVADSAWKYRRCAISKYFDLRIHDRPAAERYMSKLFQPRERLQLALRDDLLRLPCPLRRAWTRLETTYLHALLSSIVQILLAR